MTKVLCSECDWHGESKQLLTTSNPFRPVDNVKWCPDCFEPNCFVRACDFEGCYEPVTCGTPTPGGYRNTCFTHDPVRSTANSQQYIDIDRG